MKALRWAIGGMAAGGVLAALSGYAVWAYWKYKREWEAFTEECG